MMNYLKDKQIIVPDGLDKKCKINIKENLKGQTHINCTNGLIIKRYNNLSEVFREQIYAQERFRARLVYKIHISPYTNFIFKF